jgi:hypothetical protein
VTYFADPGQCMSANIEWEELMAKRICFASLMREHCEELALGRQFFFFIFIVKVNFYTSGLAFVKIEVGWVYM